MNLVVDGSRVPLLALALIVCSLGVAVSVRGQTLASPDWGAADARTVRLAPSAFVALSTSVREELSRRGCTIPQSYFSSEPHNVIVGAFTGPTSHDIAVLCSKNGLSSILVFRNGSGETIDELSPERDINRLQVVDGQGRIGFSRKIAPVAAARIRQYVQRSGGPARALEHAGIEDLFVEKMSVVWYWDRIRWIQFPGAN